MKAKPLNAPQRGMKEKGNVFYPRHQRSHLGCEIAAVKAVLAQEEPECGSLTTSEQPPTSNCHLLLVVEKSCFAQTSEYSLRGLKSASLEQKQVHHQVPALNSDLSQP